LKVLFKVKVIPVPIFTLRAARKAPELRFHIIHFYEGIKKGALQPLFVIQNTSF
jgi:hypothetical protein